MQKALFPMINHRVSCAYNQGKAHKACSTGKPHDYPTDLVGADTGRDWFYAPCDMVVLRKYTKASHAIWLRSLDAVDTPYGNGYLYIMVEHQDNSEMAGVGHVYKQGGKCFREGKNGNATGNHLHVSCGFSKSLIKKVGSGWKKNNKGAWVLYIPGVKPITINQAFYSANAADVVKAKKETTAKKAEVKKATPNFVVGKTYKTVTEVNVRTGATKYAKKVAYSKLSAYAKEHDKNKNSALDKGTEVTPLKIVKNDKDGTVWAKVVSGYICAYDGKKELIK